jgi:hypothetical protein
MKPNIPYLYVRKLNATQFQTSIFAEPEPGLAYEITELPFTDTDAVKRILVKEINGAGNAFAPFYSHSSTIAMHSVEVKIITLNGNGTWKNNISNNACNDQTTKAGDIPVDKRYLPHGYLIKDSAQAAAPFKLFLLVPHAAGFNYVWNTIPVKVGDRHVFTVQEVATAGAPAANWEVESNQFPKEGCNFVDIIVLDTNRAEKGKGTIRHSVADNKPFDLDELPA